MNEGDLKNLKKRYLVWCYKTVKEALDKIERKFTQLEIDRFMLRKLKMLCKDKSAAKFIDEFQAYIRDKEKEGLSLKYEGNKFKPEYLFLDSRLKAVEKAIIKELGRASLKGIKKLYEEEMQRRIMEERQEKR